MKRFYDTAFVSRLFCLLSGAVFSLSFRFEEAFIAVFPALVLFFLIWEKKEKGRFLSAYLFFAGWLLCLYTWFSALYPLSVYGLSNGASFAVTAFCCVGIPLLQAAIYAGVFQLARLFPKERPVLRALGFGALWVVTEWLLSLGPFAFPWGSVALTMTGAMPLLQTVSVWGVYGLCFAVVFVCALTAEGICFGKRKLCLSAAGVLAGCVALGSVLWVFPKKENKIVSVALVQGNVTTEEKWTSEMVADVYRTYTSMTKEAAENGAALVVLPESAIAVNFYEGGPLHRAIADITKEYGCTVILGVLQVREGETHNGLVAVSPDGSVSNLYEKRHLVPFGEYLPFEKQLVSLFPALSVLEEAGDSLVAEKTEAVLETDKWKFGCFICYDSVFTGKDRAVPDSDFSVLATNDSWFKTSSGIYEHLRFAKLRAVESGKTVCGVRTPGSRRSSTGKEKYLQKPSRWKKRSCIWMRRTEKEKRSMLFWEISRSYWREFI